MTAKAAQLGAVPLFHLLDDAARAALAALMDDAQVDEGALVFDIGEPGDRMYVVCSGAIELSTTDKLGQKLLLTVARPGELFGELSLLDEGPRAARATALEPTQLLALDRAALRQFLTGRPDAALDIMMVMGRRMRATTDRLRQTAARNANQMIRQRMTAIERITDWIAAFSGSISFLALHGLWFAAWVGWNLFAGRMAFDPYPFGFLTMCVSLEAIFLSVIVLLSQNRQAAKDHIRGDVEYEVNLKAEMEVSHLHEKVEQLQAAILVHLNSIERRLPRTA